MQQATTTPQQPAPAKPKPQPPPMPPAEFQEKDIATMDAAGLMKILKDAGSSEFQKAKACQRAGELGVKEAIPVLAAMLGDEHLSVYARYGLEPMPDPAADEALRSAMTKLKGVRLIGVINSIAKRRDAKAAPALVKMMHGADLDLARASAAALGAIGDAKDLQAALGKATGPMKMAIADACLTCADRLMSDGKRDQALALYTALSAPDVPKAVRLGAMSAIVREETSVTRPRT
jgi:HEAT repeat protein